jgi:hypothetical protein
MPMFVKKMVRMNHRGKQRDLVPVVEEGEAAVVVVDLGRRIRLHHVPMKVVVVVLLQMQLAGAMTAAAAAVAVPVLAVGLMAQQQDLMHHLHPVKVLLPTLTGTLEMKGP